MSPNHIHCSCESSHFSIKTVDLQLNTHLQYLTHSRYETILLQHVALVIYNITLNHKNSLVSTNHNNDLPLPLSPPSPTSLPLTSLFLPSHSLMIIQPASFSNIPQFPGRGNLHQDCSEITVLATGEKADPIT